MINQVNALKHHPSVVPKEKDGRLQTDIVDIKNCLSGCACSLSRRELLLFHFLLSFPPFPSRGKNESLSQQLVSVIPQYRPGFHRRPAAEALRSDITSPLSFYGHVHCQQKGLMMIISMMIRLLLMPVNL